MILQVYSVYDRVSKSFDTPFYGRSDAQVMRQLQLQLAAPDASPTLLRFPDDFELVRLGAFDTDSGALGAFFPDDVEPTPLPVLVCRLSSLIGGVDHGKDAQGS